MKSKQDPIRILLSEGSSNSARQTLYGLGARHSVDILDPSAWCQCRFSRFVRRRIPCPMIAKDPVGYVQFVANLVRRESYQVLFPTHEQVYAFSKFRDRFSKYVGLAVPDFDAIRRVQSKSEFCALMTELELPIPTTRIARCVEDLHAVGSYPLFIKLVHSTASLGVQRVSSAEEAKAAMRQFEERGLWVKGDPIVLQQPAPGQQAEVTAVFQEGRMVAAACSDVLATGIGGGPALRRTAIHEPVLSQVESLGRHLHWHGPISVEYFYDHQNQQPYYIEANPRIGESFNCLAGGVNLCEATLRISLGEDVPRFPDVRPGVMTHNGFIVMIAAAYNGEGRVQLMQRLWKHWTNRQRHESEMTRPMEDWMSLIPATAVISMLLLSPKSAQSLAHGTVENYSLPTQAAVVIDGLEEADAFEDTH